MLRTFPRFIHVSACLVSLLVLSPAHSHAQSATEAADLVERLEQLNGELAALEQRAAKASGVARLSIHEEIIQFKQTRMNPLAIEIDHSYQAKMALKNNRKELGAVYHDLMKGSSGKGGIYREVIDDVKRQLKGRFPDDIIEKIELIQNEASLSLKKAPMDADVGVISRTKEEARKLLRDLGGIKGEKEFRDALNKELKAAYKRLAEKLDVPFDPDRLYLSGTTIYDPEAYLDSAVLKEGGIANRSLIDNTAGVSKYKNDELWNELLKGKKPPEEVYMEISRGTLKDLKKVEALFDHIEEVTGVRPVFGKMNDQALDILRRVESGALKPVEADAMIRKLMGKDIKACCNDILETGFSAIRTAPHPKLLKARIFMENIADPAVLKRAIEAVVSGDIDKMPQAARQLQRELGNACGFRITTIMESSPQEFLHRIRAEFPDAMLLKKDSEAVQKILARIDTMNEKELAILFEPTYADSLQKMRTKVTPAVRLSLRQRFLKNGLVGWVVDQNNRCVQIGDADFKTVAMDGMVSSAMAMYQTHCIMQEGLSPEEESRRIERAWVASIPCLGDISEAICTGTEAALEGSADKAVKSGLFLAIGVCYAVPGAQGIGMAASLGMVGWDMGWAAVDVSQQKDIIWAWVACGEWGLDSDGVFRSGKMDGLYDANGILHTFGTAIDPEAETAHLLDQFITQGDVHYHTPLRAGSDTSGLPGMTIRESIYDFSQRTVLKSSKQFAATKDALAKLYPDFDVDKHLANHRNEGRVALYGYMKEQCAGVLKERGGDPRKTLAFILYGKLKDEYDKAAAGAVKHLRSEAEAEYQATYNVGEARDIWKRLEALEAEYHFPFTKHVDGINRECHRYFLEVLKTPLEKHSIPRRRIDLARKYVTAYDKTIRQRTQRIRDMFKRANVTAPSKLNPFNLSGYLAPDLERVEKLDLAYGTAMKDAADDVRKLYVSAVPKGTFDIGDPCVTDVYRKLASNRLRWTHANDVRLLYEEWAGRRRAATEERDAELQKMKDKTDARFDGVLTIPHYAWTQTAKLVENLYAWENLAVPTPEGLLAIGAQKNYLEATGPIRKRMDALDDAYAELLRLGGLEMSVCLSKLTVRLRTRATEGVEERPLTGGQVEIQVPFQGAVPLKEGSPGNYQCDAPGPGKYQVVASCDGYKGEDGSPIVKRPIVQVETPTDQPPPPIVETIYMVSANQPTLDLTFTPAYKKSRPTLEIQLASPLKPLDPTSIAYSIDTHVVDKPVVTSSKDGRTLSITHTFAATMPPGPMAVQVDVADEDRSRFSLPGSFKYVPGLELSSPTVEDKGGAPEDGKANAGETFRLSLKLESFEPSPLTNVKLVYLPGTPHLTVSGNAPWSLPVLAKGKPATSPGLAFTCDANLPQAVESVLAFEATVGGVALPDALKLILPLHSGSTPTISFERMDDSRALLETNNEDGKAHAGEKVGLIFHVRNVSHQVLPKPTLSGSCASPLLAPESPKATGSLQPGQEQELSIPAAVSRDVKEITTVTLVVELSVNGQQAARKEIPVTLYPPPLPIRLLGVEVEDPDSGALASRNNDNGRLGLGEHAFVDVRLVNDGPALEEVVIDLISLQPAVSIEKTMAKGQGIGMRSGQPVTRRFELDVPVDYPDTALGLRVKIVPAHVRNLWETRTSLPVDDMGLLEGRFTLSPSDPTALQPGADLAYQLTLQSTTTRELRGLVVGVSSPDVILAAPLEFYDQTFAPNQTHTYSGKIKIPGSFSASQFTLLADCFNVSGSLRVYRKRQVFGLGSLATRISAKSTMVDKAGDQWRLVITVADEQDNPVDAGALTLSTSHGSLSATRIPVQNGRAETVWTRATGVQGQALIEINYPGHFPSAGETGPRYNACNQSVFVPPSFESTLKVTVSGCETPASVQVSLTGPTGEASQTGTPALFNELPPGTYRVEAWAPGYETARRAVDISPPRPGLVYKVNLELEETSAGDNGTEHTKPPEDNTGDDPKPPTPPAGGATAGIDAFIEYVRRYYAGSYDLQARTVPQEKVDAEHERLSQLAEGIRAWDDLIYEPYTWQVEAMMVRVEKCQPDRHFHSGMVERALSDAHGRLANLSPATDYGAEELKELITELEDLVSQAKAWEGQVPPLPEEEKEAFQKVAFGDGGYLDRPYIKAFKEVLYAGEDEDKVFPARPPDLWEYPADQGTLDRNAVEGKRLAPALEAMRKALLQVQQYHQKYALLARSGEIDKCNAQRRLLEWEFSRAHNEGLTGKYSEPWGPRPGPCEPLPGSGGIPAVEAEGVSLAAAHAAFEKWVRAEAAYIGKPPAAREADDRLYDLRREGELGLSRIESFVFDLGFSRYYQSRIWKDLQKGRLNLARAEWTIPRTKGADQENARNRAASLKDTLRRIETLGSDFPERVPYVDTYGVKYPLDAFFRVLNDPYRWAGAGDIRSAGSRYLGRDIEAMFKPAPPCEDTRVFDRNAWLLARRFPPTRAHLDAALGAFRGILTLAAEEYLAAERERKRWEDVEPELNKLSGRL